MAFRYRDGGIYSVADGDVWKVGRHRFVCSDAVLTPNLASLVSLYRPDVLYADPPWSNGQAKQFRTLNDQGPLPYDWTEIFKAVLALVPPTTPRWIVGDRYSVETVRKMLDGAHYYSWPLPAFSTPSVVARLHYSGPTPWHDGNPFTGLKDQRLPEEIIRRCSPEKAIVLDPCSGLGITSRCAERLGRASLNNEVSPHRVSAAIRKMEKLTGYKPEKVGEATHAGNQA